MSTASEFSSGVALSARPAVRVILGAVALACSSAPRRANEADSVEAKACKTPNDNCFVALEGRGWTAWKVPNPDTFPNLEARALCQEGGPDHGSYKLQWRASDATKAITWNYTSSAPRQDPETYATHFLKPPGNATAPQLLDYSCGVTDSAKLCVSIISSHEP